MIYKQLLTQYGASLTGPPQDPKFDIIHAALAHHTRNDIDLISFRRRILEALSTAKAFFLSEVAADYVDNTHLGSALEVHMDVEPCDLTRRHLLLGPHHP